MRETLDLVLGFFSPAFFYAASGAVVGAAIYAVWDWIQGTAGKPWHDQNTSGRV